MLKRKILSALVQIRYRSHLGTWLCCIQHHVAVNDTAGGEAFVLLSVM